MYQDKTLTCKDCGQEFVFTAGEQEFYVWRSDPRAFHPEERPTHLLQRVLCFPPCFPLLIDEISPAPKGAGLFYSQEIA